MENSYLLFQVEKFSPSLKKKIVNNKVVMVMQVCCQLEDDNIAREIDGIVEAAAFHHLKGGLVLTFDQEEERSVNGFRITVLPVWKWLMT